MLPSNLRVSKSSKITNTYKYGKSANHQLFYIKSINNNQLNSQLAIVVPKSVSKSAVLRNKNKRRLNAIINTNWSKIKPGHIIIITVKADNSTISYQDLETAVINNLNKLNLIQ